MLIKYINMSTLQYHLLELVPYNIIYGLKNKMQAIRILYLVGSAQCKHKTYATLTILYCRTVMEALHNEGQLPALPIVSNGPIVSSV